MMNSTALFAAVVVTLAGCQQEPVTAQPADAQDLALAERVLNEACIANIYQPENIAPAFQALGLSGRETDGRFESYRRGRYDVIGARDLYGAGNENRCLVTARDMSKDDAIMMARAAVETFPTDKTQLGSGNSAFDYLWAIDLPDGELVIAVRDVSAFEDYRAASIFVIATPN